ncbi:hypothetical protein P8A21_40270 (plasmid) [Streptomyces poriferorum]|uniref:hypothetical protein n=1 Tax=Streptomyces poriferorum TaxID=2798799 RepID=UPI00273D0D74|nr:hypothetical protein [Streptomyces sp. Alt1]WLQ53768.1 hypothetical protein P8A21_40270 [Streptomyces sp. Alt1]
MGDRKFKEACVRCPMPRIDPGRQKRLIEIIHSLTDRVNEAKLNGWLSEAEGVAGPSWKRVFSSTRPPLNLLSLENAALSGWDADAAKVRAMPRQPQHMP